MYWKRFKPKEPFSLLLLASVIIVLAIVIIVPLFSFGIVDGKEVSKPQIPPFSTEAFAPEKIEPEFFSNEILIKLKPKAKRELKNIYPLSPQDTGIVTLDKLNKDHQVVKMEKVAKEGRKSKKDHEVFRWYKITLPDKKEIIKEKFSDIQKDFSATLIGELSQEQSKGAKVKGILEKYKQDPNIETVELNYIVHTTAIPNDPYYSSSGSWGQPYDDLWGLKKIQTEQAWDISTGSNQITVAIIDTGVDRNHIDIRDNMWVNSAEIPGNGIDDDSNGYTDDYLGWDFVNRDNNPMDDHGHGTHVAGTIGAVGNNGIGVTGINWNVKIMPLKFLGRGGDGSFSDAAQAIIYAADNGARVMNNSWGTQFRLTSEPIVKAAIDYAYNLDSVIVFAAGNNNDDVVQYFPANYQKTIVVAATDHNDQKASFSNWGTVIDVAAPGGDSTIEDDPNRTYTNILSLRASGTDMYGDGINIVGSKYYRARGTSMATPHVSGLAALILSTHPEFTNEEIRAAIKQSADDVGDNGWDMDTGAGRINAYRALQVDEPLVAHITEPSEAIAYFYTGQTVNILGTARGGGFESYKVEIGFGQKPTEWKVLDTSSVPTTDGILATWDTGDLFGNYQIKLTVTTADGNEITDRREAILGFQKGWPIQQLSNFVFRADQSINIADLDQDQRLELVLATYEGIFVWHADATPLDSWPISPAGSRNYRGPSLGDLDNDGNLEIVIGQVDGNHKVVHIFHHTGKEVIEGWPKVLDRDIDSEINRGPILEDIDDDGKLEIVTFELGKVYAWNFDGTDVPGWPVQLICGRISGIATGDVDNDWQKEIVVACIQWAKDIYVLSKDGAVKSHWEPNVDIVGGKTNPVLVDLDRDGDLEILVSGYKEIFAWHHDGSTLKGNWPQTTTYTPSHIVVGDINNDGVLEIVAVDETTIYAWGPDGNPINDNWPVNFSNVSFTFFCFALGSIDIQGPALGDIDGDGDQEIVIVGRDMDWGQGHGLVFALNPDGTVVEKFPIKFKGNIYPTGTPALEDLDNDGDIEIIFYLEDGSLPINPRKIIVLDSASDYMTPRVAWPMLQYDSRRSSCFGCERLSCSFIDSTGDWRRYGDVDGNGIIDFGGDAIMTAKIAFGMIVPNSDQKKAGDVDGNGIIDFGGDALLIAKYAKKITSNFPVCSKLKL